MYVSANINITNATVPALPKDAIVRNGDKYFVYIQENKSNVQKKANLEEEHNEIHFKAIEVIPGTTDLGYTEVKFVTEIPADAKIVIKEAFYLLSAMKGGGEQEH
jgi:cobalt-zinc-cadmium efflux system membrane fusion protein